MKSLSVLALISAVLAADPWINPEGGGNIWINLGDQKVNYGFAPPWDALDGLKSHCTDNGCNPTDLLEVETAVVQDREYMGAIMKISADGNFKMDGEGSLDNLVEMAKAAAGNGPYDRINEEYNSSPPCTPGPIPCDPPETSTVDQYHFSDVINVSYKEGESHLNIYVEVDVIQTSLGACEVLTKVGAAVGGAIHGALGGIFTLAELGCADPNE